MKHIKIEMSEIIIGIQKVDCIHLEGEWLVFENYEVFLRVCEHLHNNVDDFNPTFNYAQGFRIKPTTHRIRRRGYKGLRFVEDVNEFLLVRGELRVYTTFDSEEDI